MADYDPETGEVRPEGTTHRWSAPADQVFGALAKAQGEIKNAARDSTNPHFRHKYADLAAVKEACWEALTKNGITPIQMPVNIGQNVGVVTLLGHSSGQWIESTIFVQPTKFDAQGVGSVITYLRRYALAAMAGVAPDDDDGEAAVGRPTQIASSGRTAPEARRVPQQAAPERDASAGSARDEATKRWKEIAAAIDDADTVPELERIEAAPAWKACQERIVAAEGETAAKEAMVALSNRIGRRRGLLLMDADERAPLPI